MIPSSAEHRLDCILLVRTGADAVELRRRCDGGQHRQFGDIGPLGERGEPPRRREFEIELRGEPSQRRRFDREAIHLDEALLDQPL